jgi:phosphate starvation-inducible membrane PsiE
MGLAGTVAPATAILALTLLTAIHPRLQGIIITAVALGLFILAMMLIPRMRIERGGRPATAVAG